MNTLQCSNDRCKWTGSESELVEAELHHDYLPDADKVCPQCGADVMEMLVRGENYKVDNDGIIRDLKVKVAVQAAVGGIALFAFGAFWAVCFIFDAETIFQTAAEFWRAIV